MVEHYLDTVGVRGSKPLPRTIQNFGNFGEDLGHEFNHAAYDVVGSWLNRIPFGKWDRLEEFRAIHSWDNRYGIDTGAGIRTSHHFWNNGVDPNTFGKSVASPELTQ